MKKDEPAISPEEITRRVAVLKRFRELLLEQRNRFRHYLEVLDKQREVIEQGNAGELISHVELEERILGDIFSIQKVIDPLESMYQAACPQGDAREVPELRSVVEELKTEAAVRMERNKKLLSARMIQIRSELKSLQGNPFIRRTSIYADSGVPSILDISG
ncbi:flagellar protein FlgN [Treponema sp. TIM-1]|uniref:flagellar biosynthesis protein FlgN n=1 Tax=Treponema sp. TIM-1 TaxID=2898417 RepID=UPI0039808461